MDPHDEGNDSQNWKDDWMVNGQADININSNINSIVGGRRRPALHKSINRLLDEYDWLADIDKYDLRRRCFKELVNKRKNGYANGTREPESSSGGEGGESPL
ncbi:hypothetical protein KR067_005842 [Drosophila pandora]|nr:hypothetical protein KR067_005842 [Drosophila pandora]